MSVRIATRPVVDERAPSAPVVHDDLQTRVTIARTSPRDVGDRQVFVRLDDGPSVAFVYGESMTLDLQPGHHRLKAHNTLMWRTVDFTVEPGEHLEFQLINRADLFTMMLVMWLGTGPLYLTVERRSLR